ncbi:hypothetical protein OOT00_15080 [Desulfobotulus sp. H1]|uniref:Uncharacterized protein n=1 Tax=Desulfobotulus pelophilus TaxID=2823377 RepID=A0ABT3NCW6_9BACT|nr:hypothetical protein [Desulfobotulus pelophilus]MCW7755308.1 hypothetical protein [Desulfobotulus pelophilus]
MVYIGNFILLTNQQASEPLDRRHGEFQLMVKATSPEDAKEMFRKRVAELQVHTDFFEGLCHIYLAQFIALDQIPESEAVLINYQSFAGDPEQPFIDCVAPSEEMNACRIVSWEENQPALGQEKRIPFMMINPEERRGGEGSSS